MPVIFFAEDQNRAGYIVKKLKGYILSHLMPVFGYNPGCTMFALFAACEPGECSGRLATASLVKVLR